MNSYPPTFKQALVEFANYIHTSQADPAVDKEKLCEGVQRRLSIIIGKFVSAPTGESFAIFANEQPPQQPPSRPPCKGKPATAPPAGPQQGHPSQGA